jgi:hypothetical protein
VSCSSCLLFFVVGAASTADRVPVGRQYLCGGVRAATPASIISTVLSIMDGTS